MNTHFSRGNLIPTARVDKHGRTVIRHMKPEDKAGQRFNGTVPAPVVTPNDVRSALLERAASAFFGHNTGMNEEDHAASTKWLSTLSASELKTVETWAGNKKASRLWIPVVGMQKDAGRDFGRDWLNVSDYLEGKQIEQVVGEYYIAAFQKYEGLIPLEDGAAYPEERFKQFVAVTETVLSMIELSRDGTIDDREYSLYSSDADPELEADVTYEWLPYIWDEKLRNLIVNPEHSDAARKIIGERGIVNADDITAIISGSEHALLGEGAL